MYVSQLEFAIDFLWSKVLKQHIQYKVSVVNKGCFYRQL